MAKQSGHQRLRALGGDSRGATAVEYGLILSLIFLALMTGVIALGGSVQQRWNDIAAKVVSG